MLDRPRLFSVGIGADAALLAAQRPVPDPRPRLAGGAGAMLAFLHDCRREVSRRRRIRPNSRLASDHHGHDEPTAQRLQWVLAALEAYERGLTANAAIRKADAEVNGAARAQQEFLAFLSYVGDRQTERSLATSLRQHMLAQAIAPFRMIALGLGRVLQRLRANGH